MTEEALTKLSPPTPTYQNLRQRAPSVEVLQNSGIDTYTLVQAPLSAAHCSPLFVRVHHTLMMYERCSNWRIKNYSTQNEPSCILLMAFLPWLDVVWTQKNSSIYHKFIQHKVCVQHFRLLISSVRCYFTMSAPSQQNLSIADLDHIYWQPSSKGTKDHIYRQPSSKGSKRTLFSCQ